MRSFGTLLMLLGGLSFVIAVITEIDAAASGRISFGVGIWGAALLMAAGAIITLLGRIEKLLERQSERS
jgi:hypothetical protein